MPVSHGGTELGGTALARSTADALRLLSSCSLPGILLTFQLGQQSDQTSPTAALSPSLVRGCALCTHCALALAAFVFSSQSHASRGHLCLARGLQAGGSVHAPAAWLRHKPGLPRTHVPRPGGAIPARERQGRSARTPSPCLPAASCGGESNMRSESSRTAGLKASSRSSRSWADGDLALNLLGEAGWC